MEKFCLFATTTKLAFTYDIMISFLLVAAQANAAPSAPSCARAVICSQAYGANPLYNKRITTAQKILVEHPN